MSIVFRAGNPNFPADQDELNKRLNEIEQLVNKYDANIPFCEKAFKLIEDCDLITEDNVRFLCSAEACKKYDSNFWFIRNRKEGVLRPTKDYNNVFTRKYQRFYSGFDMHVEFYEQNFLIVNDWYKDFSEDRYSHQRKPSPCPNKQAFYNWLKEKAQNACEKHWTEQNHSKDSETIDDIFDDIFDTWKIESTSIDKFTYSISIDSYIGSAGNVTIPVQIDGLPVTSIGAAAFWGCENLTEITIPDSVKSIGNSAFRDCKSLTKITIPDSVISIGAAAFEDCTSLIEITIPNSVISIGNSAFWGCKNLTEITIPEGVELISNYAFFGCKSLTEITIQEGVTSCIGDNAFCGCENLTEITIPCSVISIGDHAFEGCESLSKITIQEGVTYIGDSAFPEGVELISNYAFFGCKSLSKITIQEGVTYIGDSAFPEGVKSIGDYAFCGCDNLTEITIPCSVISIGDYAFEDCESLSKITIQEGVTYIDDSAFLKGVKSIGDYAFCGCDNLTEITIPDSVTFIGYMAFYGCENLETIYINNLKLLDKVRRQNPSCKILPIPKK